MATSRRGRHTPDPDVVLVVPRRGLHESRRRQTRTPGERARIVILLFGVVALFGVLAAALSPFWGNRSQQRQVVPIPAAVSQPPLVPPVPTAQPSATRPPSAPPGFPTAIPTGATPTSPAPGTEPTRRPIRTITVEAESAANALRGQTQAREVDGASGGLVVTAVGASQASTIGFDGVNVPAAGTYTLTVFYLSDPDRGASVRVNGGQTSTVNFPGTGDRDTVASLALRINLDAGPNVIEFGGVAGRAPDLDRITVNG